MATSESTDGKFSHQHPASNFPSVLSAFEPREALLTFLFLRLGISATTLRNAAAGIQQPVDCKPSLCSSRYKTYDAQVSATLPRCSNIDAHRVFDSTRCTG